MFLFLSFPSSPFAKILPAALLLLLYSLPLTFHSIERERERGTGVSSTGIEQVKHSQRERREVGRMAGSSSMLVKS
jgi:hypothetical protein